MNIKVHFSAYTGEWNIEGKSYDRSNVKAYSTYGTGRINAYKIIEETLNLKDVRIFDYVEDADGKKKAVLNKKETAIAQAKQELIKQGFQDWVWSDPERRERLCRLYNDKFNSLRPREYDGSHIVFSGMNRKSSFGNTKEMRWRTSSTAAIRCLHTPWAQGKPSRWFRRRWSPNGSDCAANPCLSYPITSPSSGHRSSYSFIPQPTFWWQRRKTLKPRTAKSSAAELPPVITMPSLSGIRSSRKYRCPLNGSGRSSNSSLMKLRRALRN